MVTHLSELGLWFHKSPLVLFFCLFAPPLDQLDMHHPEVDHRQAAAELQTAVS